MGDNVRMAGMESVDWLWLRIGTSGGIMWTRWWNFGVLIPEYFIGWVEC